MDLLIKDPLEGMSCFALQYGTKEPTGAWKQYQTQKPSAEEFQCLMERVRNKERNLAIVTGNISEIWVLDIDGEDGANSLIELKKQHGEIPKTCTVKTGKGLHLYFKYPENATIRNAGSLLHGIDVRGEGGYIVAPPSLHENGSEYSFINKTTLDDIIDAPEWLLAIVSNSGLQRACKVIRSSQKGNRNNTLNKEAFKLFKSSTEPKEKIEKDLLSAAMSTGLIHEEATKTINSAATSAANNTKPFAPLNKQITSSEPIPMDALPEMMRDSILRYQEYGQQPTELILISALAAASVACQGIANIKIDEKLEMPLSLFMTLIAESGERKTSADAYFQKPIKNVEKTANEKYSKIKQEYDIQKTSYESQVDGITQAIKKAAKERDTATVKKQEDALKQLEAPKLKSYPKVLLSNATLESVVGHLAKGFPSILWGSSEGGLVVNSHSFKEEHLIQTYAALNTIWDSGEISMDRKISESFSVKNGRVTYAIMLQPAIALQLFKNSGNTMRGIGFLARSFMLFPSSTIGTRQYIEPTDDMADTFLLRIEELLKKQIDSYCSDQYKSFNILTLNTAAKKSWTESYNKIEKLSKEGSDFGDYKDFASKFSNNVARLAGIFHIIDRNDDSDCIVIEEDCIVQKDHMDKAIKLAEWLLRESIRCVSNLGNFEDNNALDLFKWLLEHGFKHTSFKKREVQQRCPHKLRNSATLQKTLDLLVDNGYITKNKNSSYNVTAAARDHHQ